jgi:demethylmenaquinone methyltransferase/2-methoxy-6-polyprenyl-1,4-benzoquinol methylase/phosphoethanolamine N-methyltransferase
VSLSDSLSQAYGARGQVLDWLGRAFDPIQGFFMLGRRGELFGQVLDSAEIRPGDAFLDVGCGTGTLLHMAARRSDESCLMVGLEPADSLVGQARRKLEGAKNRAYLVRAYAEMLPFPSESFDIVAATAMLHHLAYPEMLQRVLHEVHRVLRTGGRLVALDFWPPRTRIGKALHFHFRWNLLEDSGLFYRREFPRVLRSAGFERVMVEPRQYFPTAVYRADRAA